MGTFPQKLRFYPTLHDILNIKIKCIAGGVSLIEYTLVRSDRRTLGIYILPDGRVEVRAPRRCPVATIEAFLSAKHDWIARKQQAMLVRLTQRSDAMLGQNNTLPYQGAEMPVRTAEVDSLSFDGGTFCMPTQCLECKTTDSAVSRAALVTLYKKLTLPLVQARVLHYAALLGVNPSAVRVSGAVKRWGSCSGRGNLNFSWMLAAVDPRALDYVVVHELCHIREHNHSAAFWALVSAVLPDYRQRQSMLRETEQRLANLIRILD